MVGIIAVRRAGEESQSNKKGSASDDNQGRAPELIVPLNVVTHHNGGVEHGFADHDKRL